MVGIERILDVAERFGIYHGLKPMFSVVLGAQETTLMKLANAYAMLVNGGKQISPALIERIQNRQGKTIYRRDTRRCEGCVAGGDEPLSMTPPVPADNREQVTDPRVAYQVVSIMEGVVQRGTAVRARSLNRPVGGKTGTTNDSRDAWFIGFTPDLVAGVYIGFDNPRKLGNTETGGKAALPAFIEFMEAALKDKPSIPFRIPDGVRLMKLDVNTGRLPGPGTQAKDIILEAFKEGDNPGSMPVLDVSIPVFDTPVDLGDGAASENPYAVPNGNNNSNPGSMYQPEQPVQRPEYSDPPVSGTGGLY